MNGYGKLLGIDHGITRIGLAVSDPMRISARALTVIVRKSRAEDFAEINRLALQENIVGCVVGMPYNQQAEGAHTQADTVRLWMQRYTETTSLPIVEWDEQLTSSDAEQLARRTGRKANQPIDDLAAQLMLQSFLDALHDGLAAPFWEQ
jgi:putative holliday junction resolvase